ncbi:MAG: AAA family ATPase [Clostridiaceae bacterium]
MRIKCVHIENFRSIKLLDFTPSNYCVLVGENNAGKSNILKAINLVLGETWPSERSFSQEDFYKQDTQNDIVIQVFFDEVFEEYRNNCKCAVAGFELRCKAYKRRVGSKPAGSLKVEYCAIDSKGKICEYPSVPYQKGEKNSSPRYPLSISRDLRERVPFIYVDVLRDYSKQDPGSRWSILRKLFTDINTSIASDKTKIKVTTSEGEVLVTRKEAFELKIREAYGYLKTDEFNDIEQRIRRNSLQQMGLKEEEGDISIRFDTYDPMNVFKNLQLFIEQMGISTTADMVGAGLQSAIVIAIFRTYEEIKKGGAIFAIEEPEVFLHPQKQRFFRNVLCKLSEDNQVFLTTHSPTFIRIYEPEYVCIIRKTPQEGTTAKICEKDELVSREKDVLKIENYFDNQRNEMFFARGVVFVEGSTEKFVFPYASRKQGIDLDRYGISVIECGGKGNLRIFAKIAHAFSIPFVIVVDSDIIDTTRIKDEAKRKIAVANNKENAEKNKGIQSCTDSTDIFWMSSNIEVVLGINERSENKIQNALDAIKGMEEIPVDIMRPLQRILEMVNTEV